jgi:hypothetical protein
MIEADKFAQLINLPNCREVQIYADLLLKTRVYHQFKTNCYAGLLPVEINIDHLLCRVSPVEINIEQLLCTCISFLSTFKCPDSRRPTMTAPSMVDRLLSAGTAAPF